ncbi:MAG: phenylalanine--tRNA ligase subunit alpha [bacterium]
MENQLLKLKQEILGKLKDAGRIEVLRALEIKYLGRKSELAECLKAVSGLGSEEKKSAGKIANDIKREIASEFARAKAELEKSAGDASAVDPTLPGFEIKAGHLHPLTIIQNEIEDLFSSMGFMVLDGPELESDYYNFTALNIPRLHPARDMQDTFYVDYKNEQGEYDKLMRTQTSPMQIRAMLKYGAPLKCVAPGRCFRRESTDVRHEHTFYQLEGLMIGEDINFSNLKAVLEVLGKKLFGPETVLRMRPKFYPFVEPGSNGEYSCFLCSGKGCRLCKNTGWLEIMGCGMVHPNVLKAGGIDPQKYQGFAFGYGLDRLAMLKYGINDIRLFHSGDLRFLKQF